MSSKNTLVIAIDGPSASGKSTVARLAAKKLNINYVDSGSFYRAITWKALHDGLNTADDEQISSLIKRFDFQCFLRDGAIQFALDGEEPGDQIRSQPVQDHVSDIAAMPDVRAFIVDMLRDTVRFGPLAMEGRDIVTVVFPDSPFKYYLDASPEERARRRYEEMAEKPGYDTVDEVYDSLARRDRKDTTRKAAPLQIALGAKVIDSTELNAEEVVNLITDNVRAAGIQV